MKFKARPGKIILEEIVEEEKKTKSGIFVKEVEATKRVSKFVVYDCWKNEIPKGTIVIVPKYGLYKFDIMDPNAPDDTYYGCEIREVLCTVFQKSKS